MEYHCTEKDQVVKVKVLRRGSGQSEVSVKWRTENVNTVLTSFSERTGMITFAKQEFEQIIEVGIVDDDNWNVEAVEKIVLHDPINCNLGDLWCTAIVVLNEVFCNLLNGQHVTKLYRTHFQIMQFMIRKQARDISKYSGALPFM